MFGDMAHGLCLLCYGIYLSRNSDNKSLCYLILLFGFFSFYNGLIYNEFAGLSLNLFGSCYSFE